MSKPMGSKSLEDIAIQWYEHITYNDARGETIKEIKGKLDIRVFHDGTIRFRFWPEGYTTDDEIQDIQISINELLTIKPALELIRNIKE